MNGNKLTEEDMHRQLKKLEKEQQDFEQYAREIKQEETEQNENTYKEYIELDHMRENCIEDRRLLQLIDEKQKTLTVMRKKQTDLIDEIQRETNKHIREFDRSRDKTHHNMQLLKEKKTNG